MYRADGTGEPSPRHLLRLLRPQGPRLLLAVLCGVLSLGSALALAGVSAWLITRAWEMPPVLDLSVAAVAVRTFGISRGVLNYCERLVSHDTALRAAGNARVGIYLRLMRAPAQATARHSGADLAGRFGADVDELSEVIVRAVLPIAVATVISIAAVGVIGLISPAAATVLAGCLLLAGAFGPWLSARAAGAAEVAARTEHARRDAAAMLALEHAAELKISGMLSDVIAESMRHQHDWSRSLDQAARPAALAAAAATAAVGISVLGSAVAGIALSDSLAPTTVAILMLLPLSAFEATTALPAAAVALTRARISARRLLELGDDDDRSQPRGVSILAGARLEPRLQARAVRTGYAGIPASAPVDLDLPPGARLVVTGPSGAGKSTLLMTLAGLLPPCAGQVTLGGVAAPADLDEHQVRATVSYFAEDAHLFDTTVRDNLLVVRGDGTDPELIDALTRTGLAPWLNGLPDGLSAVLTGGAAALSGGQRRRLLLARALLSRAPIVLLDEPTEHLDVTSGTEFLRELLVGDGLFGSDRTVVVATHQLPGDLDCPRLKLEASGYPGCRAPISNGLIGSACND